MRPTDHLESTTDHTPIQCATCGDTLAHQYFALHDRSERYCERCVTTRAPCATCHAPLPNQNWLLHDGRRLCDRCHRSAVFDPTEAQQLFNTTITAVMAQLGLTTRRPVHFRLVDAPTLAQLWPRDAREFLAREQPLGLCRCDEQNSVVYVLYGVPRLTFRTVTAHEYAHAWQFEVAPKLTDLAICEGFAEWVAYRHLLYIGSHRAAARMLTAEHPYRPWLEQTLQRERTDGPTGVLAHIRAGNRRV